MTPFIANQSNSIDLTTRFKSLYNGLLPLLKSLKKEDTIEQIDNLLSRIGSNEVTVLVCGEFKRGKSSLVNALIGEDLCPVDDCIATSSVSIIKYGAEAKVTRHFIDSSNQIAAELVDYNRIAQFSKGSSINIDNTIFLEIEIPSERLKSGLCIIDTPGIGGLDARHLSLTSLALSKTECILFVTDAGEPMSASELNFIKDKIVPFGRNLKVILNKIDTLTEEQIPALIKDTQKKIYDKCSHLEVDVIPTSMYQWQLYGVTADDKYRVASNMTGLEKGIDDIRKTFKESLYPLLKSRILQAANEVKTVLLSQLQAITDPNPEIIVKLQEQGRLIAQTKEEIKQPSSKFNRELSAMIEEVQNEVMTKFSTDTIILSSEKLEEILSSDYAQTSEGIKFVSEKLNNELLSLTNRLDGIIDKSFEEIMVKSQLSFDENKPIFDSFLPSNMRLKEKTLSEKIFMGVRNSMSGMGVFSATSIVGGFIASAPVVIPIAAIGGIAMAWKAIVTATHAATKAEIRQQVQPRLTIAINELKSYIQNRLNKFSNSLKEMLLGRVAEMEAEMTSIRLKMEECATDMQKIAHQKSELQKKISFIDTTSNQLNVLLNNPFKAK